MATAPASTIDPAPSVVSSAKLRRWVDHRRVAIRPDAALRQLVDEEPPYVAMTGAHHEPAIVELRQFVHRTDDIDAPDGGPMGGHIVIEDSDR